MKESLSTYIKRHIPGCNALELARQAEIPKSTLYRWWQESPARVKLLVWGLASQTQAEPIGEVAPMVHVNWDTGVSKSVVLVDQSIPLGTKVYATPPQKTGEQGND